MGRLWQKIEPYTSGGATVRWAGSVRCKYAHLGMSRGAQKRRREMSNYNDKSYDDKDEMTVGEKMRGLLRNRAFVVTAVTLLVVFSVIIAATVAANRAKQNDGGLPAGSHSETTGESKPEQGGIGKETIPSYNGQETEPTAGNQTQTTAFQLPVSGKLMKDHDPSMQVYSQTMGDYRAHLGVDIATEISAPVCAVAAGKVARVWNDPLMGTCVAVSHEGDVLSVYKNLAKTLAEGIEVGMTVKAGQQLGTVGDSSILEMADTPHLHLEMTVGGLAADPLDYFSKETVQTISKDTAFDIKPDETGS